MIQIVRIYSQDIGMEVDIEKCAMFIMKTKKIETMEGIEQSNQESIRAPEEKENYQYLWIVEERTNKQVHLKIKMKRKRK